MLDKVIQIYKIPSDVIVISSSGELLEKSTYAVLNKTEKGYVFLFNRKKNKTKGLWLFPNYCNAFLIKNTMCLIKKKKAPKVFLNPFLKHFYKNLYYFHGFGREVLHFVGVGYKIHYFRRRKKFKIYLWVGYCTWQIAKLHPKAIRKRDHESFRLMSLKVFSSSLLYFKKMVLIIKNIRLSEPYKGKGIRYMDEKIRRKPGKTGRI